MPTYLSHFSSKILFLDEILTTYYMDLSKDGYSSGLQETDSMNNVRILN